MIRAENIDVRLQSRLVEIFGQTVADGVVIEDEYSKKRERLDAPGCAIFIYAGSTPNTELFSMLENKEGYLVVNEKQETDVPGVYAAGDICVKQIRQAATAVADGAIAAINAAAYIKNNF